MGLPAKLLDLDAHITARPYRVSADERPIWRISVVLAAVPFARAGAATRSQIHVLYWAARSTSHADQLSRFLRGGCSSLFVPFSADPSTDVAIALAASSRMLLRNDRHRFELTATGIAFSAAIAASGALASERDRLTTLPRKLTLTDAEALWRAK